jgi:hypothetical protein
MEFEMNIVKPSVRNRDGLTKGQVVYNVNTDVFYVIVKEVEYKVNAYDFTNIDILYSKPTNDNYKEWTKKVTNLTAEYTFKTVSKYWSIIKDKQYVRGNIISNEFIIVKYE